MTAISAGRLVIPQYVVGKSKLQLTYEITTIRFAGRYTYIGNPSDPSEGYMSIDCAILKNGTVNVTIHSM